MSFSLFRLSVVRRWSRVAAWVAVVAVVLPGGLPLSAQEKKAKDAPPAEPEEVSLKTEDGVKLVLTYFPGTKSRESIPVILLHAYKGSRQDYVKEGGLAPYLQEKLGCAVVVPDLRGHGESKSQKTLVHNKEKQIELNAKDFKANDFDAMVTQDLRAVKDFLWKKNNKEQLNIDKMVVVGTEMGGALALNFALYDSLGYEQRTVAYGPLKLGRFVKAAVLISPDLSFRGVRTAQALGSAYLKANLPVLIVVGKDNRARFADAEKLYGIFSKSRPPAEEANKELLTVWYKKLDTSLPGNKLLDEESLGVPKIIGQFIYYRLVKNADEKEGKWQERKYPHQE